MTPQSAPEPLSLDTLRQIPQQPAEALIESIAKIVSPLAEALGPKVEVVLHDLRQIPDSIVAVGGKLSGRATGGPSTDLLLQHVREERTDHVLRYSNRTDDGRELLSSTIFLRDDTNKAVACLCINMDISPLVEFQRFIDSHTATAPEEASDAVHQESFFTTTDDLVNTMITQAIDTVGVPVELMHKPHKLRVVADLEERGFFSFREAAEILAKALGVSRYSIYNYLNEIRAEETDAGSS